MAKKKLFKGQIGRAIVRGQDLSAAMRDVASRWVEGVQKNQGAYMDGLAEYLAFYLPQVVDAYQRAIQESGAGSMSDYFASNSLGLKAQVAQKVWEATRKIAAQWRDERVRNELQRKANAVQRLKAQASMGTRFAGANKEEPVKKVTVSSVKI